MPGRTRCRRARRPGRRSRPRQRFSRFCGGRWRSFGNSCRRGSARRLRLTPRRTRAVQHRNRRHHLGDHRACGTGRRSDSRGGPPTSLEHLQHDIALVWIQTAELVLDVDTGLAAHVDQVFRLDIQLARQRIDTDFFLQSELLYTAPRFSLDKVPGVCNKG